MKIIIFRITLLAFLFNALNFQELQKLPFLLHHYYNHKSNEPSILFSAFLYNHYVLNKSADSEKDRKENNQLPFKDVRANPAFLFAAIMPDQGLQFQVSTFALTYHRNPSGAELQAIKDIWLPPKVS